MRKRIRNYCCASISGRLPLADAPVRRSLAAELARRSLGRKILVGFILALTATLGSLGRPANLFAEEVGKATTSKEAKAAAIQSIPFEKLDKADRAKVSALLSSKSIYRRLPVHVTQCDPKFYDFCLKHPDLVVNIWQVFGVTDLMMKRVGPDKFWGRDEEGTEGTAQFLYRDYETTVVLIEGQYNGPLLTKPMAGRALMVLRTGFVRNPDGKYLVTSQLDTFTQIDNVALDFFTRTLQPLLGRIADNNFVQTSAFIGNLSRTAEANPRGVKGLNEEMKQVDEATKLEFAKVIDDLAARATRQASYEAKAQTPGQFR